MNDGARSQWFRRWPRDGARNAAAGPLQDPRPAVPAASRILQTVATPRRLFMSYGIALDLGIHETRDAVVTLDRDHAYRMEGLQLAAVPQGSDGVAVLPMTVSGVLMAPRPLPLSCLCGLQGGRAAVPLRRYFRAGDSFVLRFANESSHPAEIHGMVYGWHITGGGA